MPSHVRFRDGGFSGRKVPTMQRPFLSQHFSVVPRKHVKAVGRMLKAIHAQEDKDAVLEKAKRVAEKLREMNLNKAADKLLDGIAETLTYMDFQEEHRKKFVRTT